MQGSVRMKGKTWSYRIDLGKINGKRNQIEKSGYKTEREAQKAMNDVIYHYNHTGDYIENQRVTFQENYEDFMKNEAPATRAYATIKKYQSLYENHLKAEFGPHFLYQITPASIEAFINAKSLVYSQEYAKGFYKAIRVLFAYAMKKKLLKKTPMAEVSPPPDPRHVGEIKVYSPEERQRIQVRIASTNLKCAYYIGLNTGVRVSECFALRWSDVDFEKKHIKISKQLLFQDRKWCFTPLKTKNSYRAIAVTDEFLSYLRQVQADQKASAALYGDAYHKYNTIWDRRIRNQDEQMGVDDFINIKQNGLMLTSDSEKFLARVIKSDLGIHFKFHNLRHTYATILAENGINPRYVQEQLGHAKLEFTLRYYTHVTEIMGNKAMEAMKLAITMP